MSIRSFGLISLLSLLSSFAFTQTPPIIFVFPESIEHQVPQNGMIVDSFMIANLGQDTLRYSLSTSYAAMDTFGYTTVIIHPPSTTIDSLVRGAVYQATEDVMLLEFRYEFETQSSVHIEFFVFEGSTLLGDYQKIFSRIFTFDSLNLSNQASSGPVSTMMDSGSYYIIGVSWDHPLTYHSSGGSGNESPSLDFIGDFIRSDMFPSDSSYVISTPPDEATLYNMSLVCGYPLWLDILSDSMGALAADETTSVQFEARRSQFTQNTVSHFLVDSNDPVDSLKLVAVTGVLFTEVSPFAEGNLPASPLLEPNYPNPFNSETTIRFSVPTKGDVSLKIFDAVGREMRTLVSDELDRGSYQTAWKALDASTGVYFMRLQTSHFSQTRKIVLLR